MTTESVCHAKGSLFFLPAAPLPLPSIVAPRRALSSKDAVGLPGLTTQAANGKIAKVRVILWAINPSCRKHCSP